jgi:ketosteroid isomerase-like protein
MKKISLVLLFWCLGIANTSAQNIEETLKSYMNAWSEHSIPKISSFFAYDVIWYDLPSDTMTKGKEKVSKAITDAFMSYVPNMYWIKTGDTFVSGNTVVYEWTYGGTFDGKWGDTEIKNKEFSIKGISSTTINDGGKIISQKDYYDADSFKRALGLVQ